MAEKWLTFLLVCSHMLNNYILNIFLFSNFAYWNVLDPVSLYLAKMQGL